MQWIVRDSFEISSFPKIMQWMDSSSPFFNGSFASIIPRQYIAQHSTPFHSIRLLLKLQFIKSSLEARADWMWSRAKRRFVKLRKLSKFLHSFEHDCQLYSIAIFNYLLAYLKHYLIGFLVVSWWNPSTTCKCFWLHSPWIRAVMS